MGQGKELSVMELFAGVGGFRLGLEKANKKLFKVIWANQWEPARKSQDAFNCYTRNFNEGVHSNDDISEVPDEVFQNFASDLVVGGFPCQDYSVARSLSGEKGIQGKKGVLFWEIERVLKNSHPKYVLLENVDRLLKSPSSQRGRDFAVMLATFDKLDYNLEWRVINAADYGHAQRRRRVFIFAYKKGILFDQEQQKYNMEDIIFREGFFAIPFPVKKKPYLNRISEIEELPMDRVDISDNYSFGFHTSGIMRDGKFLTAHVDPVVTDAIPLKDILLNEEEVTEEFYLNEEEEKKFEYLRGAKKVERTSATGHKYYFSEGGMSLTDALDLPGRTMLTSEGTKNRSSHIVEVNGRKRYLTPVECERLNGFSDNWTEGMPNRSRYFCMGNALVVNLVETMGKRILEIETSNLNEKVQLGLF